MKYLKKLDEVNEGKKVESKHPIMPYFLAAKEFLKEKKIKDIMDSAMMDQEAYDGDVYFTIENLDGTFDMVQYEGKKIHVDQDLNGKGKKMIYPTIEEFKKKYAGTNEGHSSMSRLKSIDEINESWSGKLQKQYDNFEEFEAYNSVYNLASRLGYESAEAAWEDNPTVSGSTNPGDYKTTKNKKQVAVGKNGLFSKS